MKGQKTYYEDQFLGMDRRLDPDKLGSGNSPLAVNVDLDRLGSVRGRKGQKLIGGVGSNGEVVQSLVEYVRPDGSSEVHMVRNSVVYKLNTATNTWVVIDSTSLTATGQVQSVTFKNRVYYTSPTDNLAYTTGELATPLTVVGTGTNRIKGECLAVGQRTLYIGNVTVNNVYYPDRVYYSEFDTTNATENDQFWNFAEDGLINSTRYFRVEGGIVRALVRFGNNNRVMIFSDKLCYAFDVTFVETTPQFALQEMFQVGCAGPKSVVVVNTTLYWIDRLGKMYAWNGNTKRPEEISYSIDDENLGGSVVSQIAKTDENLGAMASFGIGNKVYFSIGNINLDNQSLPNACVKFATAKNGLMAFASIDSYPDRILNATTITMNGETSLAVGNSRNVLELNKGLNDVNNLGADVAIDSFYRTKSEHFGYPFQDKVINKLMVKYRPQLAEKNYLEVSFSLNNNTQYTVITNPNNNQSNFGAIDMHNSNINVKQETALINLGNETHGQSISFEFRNSKLDQSFEISTFGLQTIDPQDSNVGIN